jgi:D-alanyl-D-alanine carboxypeptidase
MRRMPRSNRGSRPLLRLNAADFEAFVRGSRSGGSLTLHRKLDGREIAAGSWSRNCRRVRVALAVNARERAAVRLALLQLQPRILAAAARQRVALNLRFGRQSRQCPLPARGPALARAGGGARGPLLARSALAASLREIPADYGTQRRLVRRRDARVLAFAGTDVSQRECWLQPAIARRVRALIAAAAHDGIVLQLVSGFRSAAYQARIIERKRARGEPLSSILAINAAPGYSEHHSGRAVDLTAPGFTPIEEPFESSPAFAWLQANAGRFRIRLSYPRNNPHRIVYEPWHWYFED